MSESMVNPLSRFLDPYPFSSTSSPPLSPLFPLDICSTATGLLIKDAAWYYPDPKAKFRHCKDYVAFCMYAPLMLHLKRVPFRLR